jgi:mono/diheme cytochrome c family protein
LKLHHALLPLACLAAAACRQDMHDQPKHKPFTASAMFRDHRSARPLVPGTVARDHLDADDHFFRGKVDGKPAETFPAGLADSFGGADTDWQATMLARGRERFQIHCTPCHGSVGDGNGMVVQRGMRRPPSYHIERLQKSPPGHFFDVITNGIGQMFDLSDRVQPADRWAIVAYVRALQLSQNALLADVPANLQASIPAPGTELPRADAPPAHESGEHGGAEHEGTGHGATEHPRGGGH